MSILGVTLLITVSVQAQTPGPVGEQFQVNSYTTSYQSVPTVAADSQGNFVVVWISLGSYGTDTSQYSIQAQRFEVDGTLAGGQFQVNSYTTNLQLRPSVAADAQGNFVVVWDSTGSSGTDRSDYSIQAQRYDAGGTPVGEEFQVNSYTADKQRRPAVAAHAQGNLVVVWDSDGSYGNDSSLLSIQAQRYDAVGAAVGEQFQVNSYATSYQAAPAVAVDAQGNFVVVWFSVGSFGTDTNLQSIQGQRFDADGISVGGQFQINSYTTNSQVNPEVAADAQGNFVVVWQSYGSAGTDTSDKSVQAQRYDASGTAVGDQFQVNSYTAIRQDLPKVAVDDQGNFVVAWRSTGSYGTDPSDSIQVQFYSSNGTAVGGQFQVNSYTTSYQYRSAVAADGQGNFVVAWESHGSYGTDTSGYSIQGQRFAIPIFADGFESGDFGDWIVFPSVP